MKTAMQQLRDKLMTKIKEIKDFSGPYEGGQHQALKSIVIDIDTEMMKIEKEVMIDFHVDIAQDDFIEEGREPWEARFLAENHYNQEFKQ